jgi:hypothetical protein
MADDKDKKDGKKDEGAADYVKHVIDNPNLEKELKETGSPYKIPDTPQPGKDGKK